MRKVKFIFISVASILSFVLMIFLFQVKDTKADDSDYEVDISTTPAQFLFDVKNMKPGDWSTSSLKINNEGNLDFNYSISSHHESGDSYLYNQFLVWVSDREGLLYEGKLSDFSNFPLGTIAAKGSNTLIFKVELPYETGNEAQGKSTSVTFELNAIGHKEEIPIGDQCFEPPFSNRNFTQHQNSTVPIKFHIEGSEKSDIQKNVRLEVTGPSTSGDKVKYVFTTEKENLDLQKVNPPHYHAQFSPFNYPVMTDKWYTATVYVDNKVYCNRTFEVLSQGNRSNAP
jgi:hypothetical protein